MKVQYLLKTLAIVSSHGHMVRDLQLSDTQIRDDKKAPEEIYEFIPHSTLPSRLGLLIDTSGSIQDASPLKSEPPKNSSRRCLTAHRTWDSLPDSLAKPQ